MAGTGLPEIIDLTESSPPPQLIVFEEDIEVVGEKEQRKARRKRRKKKTSESLEVAESSTQPSRNQSRERHAERNWDPSRKRFLSAEPRKGDSSPRSRDDFTDPFCVDVVPAQIPVSVKPTIPGDTHLNGECKLELLLPEHVSVFEAPENGAEPVEIIGPPTPNYENDKEDFIEYLDYDDRNKGLVRYFDEVNEDSKPTRFVCKNCGAEGQHKTFDCPVQICLTCGARNEHSTRSCPISKTCYACGMKGHINQNCPNRRNRGRMDNYHGCERCGALFTHKTNECPTLWRMYEYVSDDERLRILQVRETRRHLEIGQGGEGYIGGGEWCYNCGGSGHWGDDCNEVPHLRDFPREPSAFSTHNTMSGPFFDPAAQSPEYRASYHDNGGGGGGLPEGWGIDAPADVGKLGRQKDRAKLEKSFQEQEENGDTGDWFTNPTNARSGGLQPFSSLKRNAHARQKLMFGSSMKDAGRQFQPLPPPEHPKLLDRIQDYDEHRKARNRHVDRRGPSHGNSSLKRDDSSHKRSQQDDYASRDKNGRNDDPAWDNRYGDRRRDGERTYRRDYQRDSRPLYTGGYSK